MNTQYKSFLTKTLWVTIVSFTLRCLISWNDLITNVNVYNLYGYAGEAIGFTVALMAIYEKWLWRWNPLESVPALKRVYTGTIKSSYDNLERTATIEIKQTLLSIHITFSSGESKSKSISASINEILGEKQLTYTYLNTPKSEFRSRSEVQYGTATLYVDNPQELTGQYYTDRKTTGDMIFTPVKK